MSTASTPPKTVPSFFHHSIPTTITPTPTEQASPKVWEAAKWRTSLCRVVRKSESRL